MGMTDREKVIEGLQKCAAIHQGFVCESCEYPGDDCAIDDAIAMLKAQEARHRLEVHNIGNVDIPEGVTWDQFQAVMTGVVAALEHTDKGESWPYDEDGAVKWD